MSKTLNDIFVDLAGYIMSYIDVPEDKPYIPMHVKATIKSRIESCVMKADTIKAEWDEARPKHYCDECGELLEDLYCSKCDYEFDTCICCGALVDSEGFGVHDACQMCKAD